MQALQKLSARTIPRVAQIPASYIHTSFPALDILQPADDEEFHELVKQQKNPFVVWWTATWCGPCRAIHPQVTEMAKEHAGE